MTDLNSLQRFMLRFYSYDKAHGQFQINATREDGKQEGRAFTVNEPVSEDNVLNHIGGRGTGLGLVPLLEDNTCRWACIDIDEIGIDLCELEKRLYEHGLPLTVFRSKSGGAHLMVFMNVSVKADRVKKAMNKWADQLGFSGVEVFPKQTFRKDGQTGNWLNMPYYKASDTSRYALLNGKPLSLADCLNLLDQRALNEAEINQYFPAETEIEGLTEAEPSQPIQDMIPQGERHNELVRIGTCLRKQGYEETALKAALMQAGKHRCSPPMPDKEIGEIIGWIIQNVEPGSEYYPLTDQGNGYRFRDICSHRMFFSYEMNQYYYWDGRRYVPDNIGLAIRAAKNVALSIHEEAAAIAVGGGNPQPLHKHATSTQSKRGLESMLWAAQSEMAVPFDQLDTDINLLNLRNGVLDLKTMELLPHSPDRLITKLANVDFDKEADCPVFEKFLAKIFDGDVGIISYVQRVVGYALTGDISEHCMFILYGTGRNGKSTLLNVFDLLLGDYHSKAEARSFLKQRNEGVRNDIAALRGARCASASEAAEGAKLNEPLIKELTGGDIIKTRFLYKEYFEFKPQFKIMMAVNSKPEVVGMDEGMWSRIRLIPFVITIPKAARDKHLISKLEAELSGILNWAIAGLKEWREHGLNEPQVILDEIEAYRDEMNLVHRFIGDGTFRKETSVVGATELYECFKLWCEEEGESYLSQKQFGRRMTEMGFVRKRRSIHGQTVTGYLGIELKTKYDSRQRA